MRVLWLEEARVRIAYLLLYLYEKFGRVIPETRATIAELAGTSVETAIRITSGLVKRGILATRRGQVEILSLARLRVCAQGEPAGRAAERLLASRQKAQLHSRAPMAVASH